MPNPILLQQTVDTERVNDIAISLAEALEEKYKGDVKAPEILAALAIVYYSAIVPIAEVDPEELQWFVFESSKAVSGLLYVRRAKPEGKPC